MGPPPSLRLLAEADSVPASSGQHPLPAAGPGAGSCAPVPFCAGRRAGRYPCAPTPRRRRGRGLERWAESEEGAGQRPWAGPTKRQAEALGGAPGRGAGREGGAYMYGRSLRKGQAGVCGCGPGRGAGTRGGTWRGGRSPGSSWYNHPLPTTEACAVLGGDAECDRRKLPPVGGTATLSWPAQGDPCPPPRVMLPGEPLPGPGNLGLFLWLPAPTLHNPSSSKSFWTPSTAHAGTSAPDGRRASSLSP